MKKYRYKGPSGEVEIKSPLHVRLVESSWMLTLWAAGFMAWGAYYLIYADPYVFIGKELSIAHKPLQSDCITCHQPFKGVSDETCSSTGCHSAMAAHKETLHDTLGHRCTDCHWEHADGAFISFGIGEKDCAECHDKLKNDPDSKFYAGNTDQLKMTDVSRKIFKHRSHQFPPHYKCWQCHCTGKGTLDTPMEGLYKMSACLLCHDEKACGVCHGYHDPRDPRPVALTCIKEELMPDLQFKTQRCTSFRKRAPGHKNLTVCETGEPAIDYGKKPPPEETKPEPAQPEGQGVPSESP
jgi:hypothetical protein